MDICGHRAVILVAQRVEGTSTSVARRRVELRCDLAPDHSGPHRDRRQDEQWEGNPGRVTTLLREHVDD